MSFVQALRMRNMFPVNSDLGSAEIDLSGSDPMYEIINAYNEQARRERMQPINGLQQVANVGRSRTSGRIESDEPQMKFGGVVGHASNSGADIMNRSRNSAERLYNSYSDPKNTQDVSGPSNDTIHMERYFRRKNEQTKVESDLKEAEVKAEAARQTRDAKGWKTVTITDPANPTKQISARHNEITGETQPINLPNNGLITRTTSAAELQKQQAAETEKTARRQTIKDKAQSTLDLMDQLLDNKTGELTEEAARAVGLSAVGNILPTSKGYAGNIKIGRLKNEQILDLIGEMKAQSKTGATGFGAMNLKELGVLEKAASMLDTGLDEPTFKAELKRIKQKLQQVLEDPKIGDIKVYPNGKKGKWDGDGYEMIQD